MSEVHDDASAGGEAGADGALRASGDSASDAQQVSAEPVPHAGADADEGAALGEDAGDQGRPADAGSVGQAVSAESAEEESASAGSVGQAVSAESAEEESAAAGSPAPVSRTPPDLTSDAALDSALEALLLVVDVPAGEELLATTLEQPVARVREALQRLSQGYADAERGIDLRRVGDGWRFYTRETYAPYVERYLLDGQRAKLTRAALETLAVVAYRQPVTRARVAAVRGVNVDGVIRTLVGRGLVEEAGTDPETGGILYCTTELFLERLGLSSLKDLPPLAPLLPEVDTIDDV